MESNVSPRLAWLTEDEGVTCAGALRQQQGLGSAFQGTEQAERTARP